MDIWQIIILSLVQGLTEFLPVSSSAHLILFPQLLNWPDQGISFDVAVHVGTLSAVIWYFRHDLLPIVKDGLASIKNRKTTGQSMLFWGTGLGTIPAGLAGLFLSDHIDLLRSPLVIAATTILFGLLLWFADKNADNNHKSEHHLTISAILIIGTAQAIALIPGTSRSGITITAALLIGFSRTGATRFSFLLSIPIILLAGALEIHHFIALQQQQNSSLIDWNTLITGTVLSAVSAYFCIVYFLKMIEKISMLPFVIYRLVLGIFLFWVFL